MEKIDLMKQFSQRLQEAMITNGYQSSRSISGVDVHQLAEITGYSQQICRKYLHGQAIPDPIKLAAIASHLKISPGWLLFGDSHSNQVSQEHKITISKNLLHYIFTHANALYQAEYSRQDLPNFLIDLAYEISHIDVNDDQSKKIIDLALSSILRTVII